jgi:hypothetical protein
MLENIKDKNNGIRVKIKGIPPMGGIRKGKFP